MASKLQKPQQRNHHKKEDNMVIRSCDGSIAAFYVMKDSNMKIGRSPTNVIRSLEISV